MLLLETEHEPPPPGINTQPIIRPITDRSDAVADLLDLNLKRWDRSSYTDKSSSLRDRAMTELVLTLGDEYMSGLFLTV